MRGPFVAHNTLRSISGHAVKCLFFLGTSPKHLSGNVYRSASRLQFSEATWRRATSELARLGLIEYRCTTNGYRARVRQDKRFTWIPTWADRTLELASPRACKALLSLCRAADNRTRTVRMRLDTLADRMGSCRRAAQMAVAELRDLNVIGSARTGRSCWWWIVKPADDPDLSFAPHHAHRSDLLVRLLSSTPETDIGSACLSARQKIAATVQRARACMRPNAIGGSGASHAFERLLAAGVAVGVATRLVASHTVYEILTALCLLSRRRPRDRSEYVVRVLRSGWCSM